MIFSKPLPHSELLLILNQWLQEHFPLPHFQKTLEDPAVWQEDKTFRRIVGFQEYENGYFFRAGLQFLQLPGSHWALPEKAQLSHLQIHCDFNPHNPLALKCKKRELYHSLDQLTNALGKVQSYWTRLAQPSAFLEDLQNFKTSTELKYFWGGRKGSFNHLLYQTQIHLYLKQKDKITPLWRSLLQNPDLDPYLKERIFLIFNELNLRPK